jgi:hypothetical protein
MTELMNACLLHQQLLTGRVLQDKVFSNTIYSELVFLVFLCLLTSCLKSAIFLFVAALPFIFKSIVRLQRVMGVESGAESRGFGGKKTLYSVQSQRKKEGDAEHRRKTLQNILHWYMHCSAENPKDRNTPGPNSKQARTNTGGLTELK